MAARIARKPARSPSRPPRAVAGPPADSARRVIGFSSLKGGVGKTTLALCASEMRRQGKSGVAPRPVVLIDADVAGTEVHWVWTKYQPSPVALLDLLTAAPGNRDSLLALEQAVTQLSGKRGLLISSFRHGGEHDPSTLVWKRVLERTGPYAVDRMREVIATILGANREASVVVDLPAFDVGFAHEARAAVLGNPTDDDRAIRLVSDFDSRSVHEVLAYRLVTQRSKPVDVWRGVCVNEVPQPHIDDRALDFVRKMLNQPARRLPSVPVNATDPILCPSREELRRATSLDPQTLTLDRQIDETIEAMGSQAARLWMDQR